MLGLTGRVGPSQQDVHPTHNPGAPSQDFSSVSLSFQVSALLSGLVPQVKPEANGTEPPQVSADYPPPPSRYHPRLGLAEMGYARRGNMPHVQHAHPTAAPDQEVGSTAHTCAWAQPGPVPPPPTSFCRRGAGVCRPSGARPGLTPGSCSRASFCLPPAQTLREAPFAGGQLSCRARAQCWVW